VRTRFAAVGADRRDLRDLTRCVSTGVPVVHRSTALPLGPRPARPAAGTLTRPREVALPAPYGSSISTATPGPTPWAARPPGRPRNARSSSPRRCCRRADEQHPVQAEGPCLVEHPAQRPGRQSAAARRRADAVTDVPAGVQQDLVVLVPQRDPAEHPVTDHDPPVGAADPATVERAGRADSPASRVSQVADRAGESTSSDRHSPKPSSWTPGPHSLCASRHAASSRRVGAISSGIPSP
jgi:hypothetical protein